VDRDETTEQMSREVGADVMVSKNCRLISSDANAAIRRTVADPDAHTPNLGSTATSADATSQRLVAVITQ
jgi:hypothetical protein